MFLGHVGDMLRLMGFPALGQAASADHPADWYPNPTTSLLLLLISMQVGDRYQRVLHMNIRRR